MRWVANACRSVCGEMAVRIEQRFPPGTGKRLGQRARQLRRFDAGARIVGAQSLPHRELEEALERRDEAARGARLGLFRLHLPREMAMDVRGGRIDEGLA